MQEQLLLAAGPAPLRPGLCISTGERGGSSPCALEPSPQPLAWVNATELPGSGGCDGDGRVGGTGTAWEMSTSRQPATQRGWNEFGGIFANFGKPGAVLLSKSGKALRSGPVL